MIADNPEYADYIEILDSQDGILTVRFKPINKMEGIEEKSQEEMEKMKEKMKNIQFAISSAMVAAKMASCIATDGGMGTGSSYSSDTGDRFSVKDGIGMGINALPAEWLGPYGALIKAALKVVLELLTSTQETCAQKKFFGGGCGLDAFHYCCYDQMLTKILVAQIKAQLGRDWAHCTGITLRDLNFVSFRQCTQTDMQSGFDGTKIVLKYDEDNKLVSPSSLTFHLTRWIYFFLEYYIYRGIYLLESRYRNGT